MRDRRDETGTDRRTDDGSTGSGGLFSDLSVPQVAAGALAAVTSMLLSTQIGIAGSVIGVAVGSVVSTVASSIYKRMIATGADRIKEKIPVPGEGQAQEKAAGHAGATGRLDDASTAASPTGTRIAPESLRRQARERRNHAVQRRVTVGVIVVAVVAAIVGVWISAGFVTLATGGQGLGEKVSVIRTTSTASRDTDDAKTDTGDGKAATGSSDQGSETGSGTGDAAANDSQTPTKTPEGTGTGEGTGSATGGTGTGTNTGSGSGTGDAGTGSGTGSGDTGTGTGGGTGSGTGDTGAGTGTGEGDTGAAPQSGDVEAAVPSTQGDSSSH